MGKRNGHCKFTIKQEGQICQEYLNPSPSNGWNGCPIIAKRWDVTAAGIRHILRQNGIKIRTCKEAITGKACKPITNIPKGNAPLCVCGCGKHTKWSYTFRKWNQFIHNHHKPNAKPKVKIVCEVCGKDFYVQNKRRLTARTCSRKCHNTRIGANQPRAFAKIELALAKALHNEGLKFKMNKPLGQSIRPDITLSDYPICIEADGDYWHSLEWRKQYDTKRDNAISALGYKVLHFSETDIKKDVALCVNKIKHCLEL